jgi:hypothetical protein
MVAGPRHQAADHFRRQLNPLRRVLVHHVADHLDELFREQRIDAPRVQRRVVAMPMGLFARRAAGIGNLTRHGIIERAAERINVAGRRNDAGAKDLFGRQVIGRPHDLAGHKRGVRLGQPAGQSEIGDLRMAIRRHQ